MFYFNYNAERLPHITLTGQADIPAPNCHFKRTPTEYIFYFVTSGTMGLTEDSFSYVLGKGDCILLDPSRTHTGLPTDSDVSYYYVHFLSDSITEIDADSDYIEKHQIENRLDSTVTEQLLLPKITHFDELHFNYVESLFEMICFRKVLRIFKELFQKFLEWGLG